MERKIHRCSSMPHHASITADSRNDKGVPDWLLDFEQCDLDGVWITHCPWCGVDLSRAEQTAIGNVGPTSQATIQAAHDKLKPCTAMYAAGCTCHVCACDCTHGCAHCMPTQEGD